MNRQYTWCLALALVSATGAHANDITFAQITADDTPYGFEALSRRWDTGDLLIAPIQVSGAVGGFTGKRNALIFPEVSAFGQTLIPEVRDDTRTGLRVTSDVDLFTGVQLYAGVSSGGYAAPVTTRLTPTLSAPGEMRAGRFYSLSGNTTLGSDTGYALSLPKLELGLDVVLGGTADFTVEAALWPALDYTKVVTQNNLGRQVANLFNLGIDLNAPNIPDYVPDAQVLDELDFLVTSNDNLYRTKLPPFNPTKPWTLLQNFGELEIVDPVASRITETPVIGDKSASRSFSGDLFRAAIDIDGVISYQTTGVSFTGLEVPLRGTGGPSFGTAYYDIIDVKYGLELGYRETSTVHTNLEAMLEFFVAGTDTPIDVLIRQGDDLAIGNSVNVADWTQLPDLALLGAQSVDVRATFTALTRDLTRSLDLTLGDYMEVKAWQLGIDAAGFVNAAGVPDLQLGPLAQIKFGIAGEFLSQNLFTDTVASLRDVFDPGTMAPTLFRLTARPSLDAYLVETDVAVPDFFGGQFTTRGYTLGSTSGLRKLGSNDAPTSLADSAVIIGTATGAASSRADLDPLNFADRGQQRTVRASGQASGLSFSRDVTLVSDPFAFTTLNGLIVLDDSTYSLNADAARRFRLLTLENDGVIDGNGFLGFHALDTDGSLVISGTGTLRFDSAGEIVGGIVSQGSGHTIEFNALAPWRSNFAGRVSPFISLGPTTVSSSNPDYYAREFNGERITTRSLVARQQFLNAGTVIVDDSGLTTDIGTLRNTASGVISARNGAALRVDGTLTGRTVIDNAGRIEALGESSIVFDTNRVTGGSDTAGLFRLATGGDMRFEGSADLALLQRLDFEVGDGSLLDFGRAITTTADTAARFFIDAGGTMLLNGLRSDTGRVVIENDGLLDVVSGNVSFTGGGGLTPVQSLIAPIDLHNRGTVRIRAGAQLVFDVDIVNYSNGGATLSEGTWELLGANVNASNLTDPGLENPSYAVMQMNVSDVFGKAEDFADLVFEQEFDPDTGELLLSNSISELDTTLVNNAAHVTLSGAAHFAYFNTVRTNSGTLNLRNQHQFTTVSSYENRGGTTNVESGAGLLINGSLLVRGGAVSFSGNSTLGLDGTGAIDVVGGMVDIGEGTRIFGGHVSQTAPNGLTLNGGRSWIVREQVTIDQDGNEAVAAGLIRLGMRTLNGTAGVYLNQANVVIDGADARFEGFEESLRIQNGSLTLRNGKVYESAVDSFQNMRTMSLENAQFILSSPGASFINDGTLSIDGGSLLRADTVWLRNGSLQLDGIVDANMMEIWGASTLSGTGILKSREITLRDFDDPSIAGGALTLAGGTLIADGLLGSLTIEAGSFVVFAGTGEATLAGDFAQMADGQLKVDWGSDASDRLAIGGAATLGGGLALNFLDDFVPEIGDSLEVLTANALFGTFDDAKLIYDRALGRSFAFRYFGNSVFVDVGPAPIPVPAAIWGFASACGLLGWRRRRTTQTSPARSAV